MDNKIEAQRSLLTSPSLTKLALQHRMNANMALLSLPWGALYLYAHFLVSLNSRLNSFKSQAYELNNFCELNQ